MKRKIRFKTKAAGGRKSKANEEMEKKGFGTQPTEVQMSMINDLFRILGDDGLFSWLNVIICGWHVMRKEDSVRLRKS